MAEPAYSITCPVAPAAPICAMIARITSFATTPTPSVPSMVMRSVFGRRCHSVWLPSTCATSVDPMPNASAPIAPWVEVWLSPHTMSMPGRLSPASGPTTCTMPWLGSRSPNMRMPAAAVLRSSASTMPRWRSSVMASRSRVSVGT